MASTLSEEQFRCIICLDIFKNPTTIPCGHNYCLECIKRFWDSRPKSECPLCKEVFNKRHKLRVNVGLKDITEKFKRSVHNKPARKLPPKKHPTRQSSASDVPCDICRGTKSAAIKSCLMCKESYCDVHLTPHIEDQQMAQHKLMDPATFISSHLCRKHNKFLQFFCKKDLQPVCMKCIETDHKTHATTPIEKEGKNIKTKMKKTDGQYKQMIQARLRKIEEIESAVELSKINKEREVQTSVQIISMVISAIEAHQTLLIDEIEQKQEAAEIRAAEFKNQLRQEITELQRRCDEIQYLEHTEDPIHLIQSFLPLGAPLSTSNWSNLTVQSDIYIGTMRNAFSKLVDVCHELEKKLSAEEVNKTIEYAVDITLDPVTAAGWLILSPDLKMVGLNNQQRRPSLPDDPRRFDSCVSVLGKQSFTNGRRYWVVQVGDKTDWDLGVARESINRKGTIMVRPDSGYWAICRRKGGSLSACAGPSVMLNLQETPQKVGVFLDYEERTVSFYNAEAKTHIYTYHGCNFTEPLYPYFNPCLYENGKNMAPLVICPLEAAFNEETLAL